MLIVSNYHYIRENFEAKYQSIFGLTPKQFENQLIELSKLGKFISQEELINYRNKQFNDNFFLITFDDGLAEQYELAKPILNKLGIPFVFFINTENFSDKKVSLVHKIHLVRSQISSEDIIDFLVKNFEINFTDKHQKLAETNYSYDDKVTAKLKYILNFNLTLAEQEKVITPLFNKLFDEKKIVNDLYFSNKQLDALYAEGALGSHGNRHLPFGIYDHDFITADFKKSQDFFKKRFGSNSKSISYPYGAYEACDKVDVIAQENGFSIGFSMERASNKELDNPLMIARYDCNDLPGGKNNLFHNKNVFLDSQKSKWYR